MRYPFKFLIATAAGMLLAAPARAEETWALVVGVSKYQNSRAITSLNFPASDATSIKEALTDAQLGGLPADHVRLLTDSDATAANITGAVDTFFVPKVKRGDQVLVFLAGHGVTKGAGADARSFFLPTDTRGTTTEALEGSAVDLKALATQLGKLPASQFVLFVDACRDDPKPGRGAKPNQLTNVMSRSAQVIPENRTDKVYSATFFACSLGQRAYEDPDYKHGVFTYHILEGIRAAVQPDAEGRLRLARLAGYVRNNVNAWVQKVSKDIEVAQTPELVTSTTEADDDLVLIRVKRQGNGAPVQLPAPTLTVATLPEGAQVTVLTPSGAPRKLGAGTVSQSLPGAGSYTVKVEAPGYAPVERSVRVLEGYEHQLILELKPGEGNGAGSAAEIYARGLEAEKSGNYAEAMQQFSQAIDADPKFGPAYERLADLKMRHGQIKEGLGVLVDMVSKAPKTAHGFSLLAKAYSQFAIREGASEKAQAGDKGGEGGGTSVLGGKVKLPFGKKKKKKDDDKDDKKAARQEAGFRVPDDGGMAAGMAIKAADVALVLDENLAEAHAAMGFAQVATDDKGDNREDALKSFNKAIELDNQDAAHYFGLGYAYRVLALGNGEKATKRDIQAAIDAQNEAIKRRPEYYEAHLELAYCYHLLGDRPNARREYELANAYRGSATDKDEVGAANVALAALYGEEAKKAKGEDKERYASASKGYEEDAVEVSPNLERPLAILMRSGLGGRLRGFMPPTLEDVMGRVRSRIPIPSVPGLNLPGLF